MNNEKQPKLNTQASAEMPLLPSTVLAWKREGT
jgi:hypothetical protein